MVEVKAGFETLLDVSFCLKNLTLFELDCKNFLNRLYFEDGRPTAFANHQERGFFLRDSIYIEMTATLLDRNYPKILIDFEIIDLEDDEDRKEIFYHKLEANLEEYAGDDIEMVRKLIQIASLEIQKFPSKIKA